MIFALLSSRNEHKHSTYTKKTKSYTHTTTTATTSTNQFMKVNKASTCTLFFQIDLIYVRKSLSLRVRVSVRTQTHTHTHYLHEFLLETNRKDKKKKQIFIRKLLTIFTMNFISIVFFLYNVRAQASGKKKDRTSNGENKTSHYIENNTQIHSL